MQQAVYQHYKNNQYYKIIDWCKIQSNDEWVDAYIYIEADKSYHKYVRSVEEFHQKFKPVLDEVILSEIKDSYSILEMVRGFQFNEVFMKKFV